MENEPVCAAASVRGLAGLGIALSGLVALAVAMGIGRFAFTPVLPMMQEDAGLSVAAGGWLASANYLGYLLGALSAVWMRVRAERAIRGGLVAIGLATLAMGLAEHFVLWVVLRALAGFMSAWVFVFASAWCLERLAPLRRPLLNGVVFAGVGAGIAAGGGLCVALMQAGASSSQAWIALGIAALALTAVAWPAIRTRGDAPHRTVARTLRDAPRWDAESVRLVLCYGASGFSYIIPATFLPVMAKRIIQDPLVFGWSWPVFGAAALVSTLAAAALQGAIGIRRSWIAGHVVMALGIALPVLRPGIAGIMLAALLVGGTFMVVTMAAMREARDAAGPHATGLIAAMTAAFAAGQIAGPISVSVLVGREGGFSAALLCACALLLVSAHALSHDRRR